MRFFWLATALLFCLASAQAESRRTRAKLADLGPQLERSSSNKPPANYRPSTPAEQAQALKEVGLAPSTIKLLVSQDGQLAKLKTRAAELRAGNLSTLAHIKGESGIPFRSWEGEPRLGEIDQKASVAVINKMVTETPKYIQKSEELLLERGRPLIQCAESSKKTQRLKLPMRINKDQRQAPLSDILFIDNEDFPKNPKAEYGGHVLIRRLHSSRDPAGHAFARSFGADCLPYRIRFSAGALQILRGAEALKNFDQTAELPAPEGL